jgi:hypothetical protein
MRQIIVFAITALVMLVLGFLSRWFKKRVDGTPAALSYFGIEYGMLYIFAFPLAGVFALTALFLAIGSLVDGGGSSEPDVDHGCATVADALTWLESDERSERDLGVRLAILIWERTLRVTHLASV